MVAINKIDAERLEAESVEFHRLGVEPLYMISAEHGRGVGESSGRRGRDLSGARDSAGADGPGGGGHRWAPQRG